MISLKHVKRFCCDDLSLIENYDEAMNDKTQIWDCHHKLEIELNLSRDELIEKDLYDNRPASELIFLTHEEHTRIHKTGELNPHYGKEGTFKGHSHQEETKQVLSIKAKEQWSDPNFVELIKEQRKGTNQGEENPAFGRRWMVNGKDRAYPKPEEFEYYKSKGYHFGYKL